MARLEPFAPGDMFVPASELDVSARFPTGDGRILQFDSQWRPKGHLVTGHRGLISSLTLDSRGILHACDPQARAITSVGPDGVPIEPFANLPTRAYGSMLELSDGTFLIGEQMVGEMPGFSGEGNVYKVSPDGTVLQTFDTETNGGVGGFLGVTHIAITPNEATLYHTSETGSHVYAHDLQSDSRLGAVFTRTIPPPMVFGVAMLSDGRLAVAGGNKLLLVDPQTGASQDVELPEGRGWAVPIRHRAASTDTPETLIVLDFFGGKLAIIEAETGKVLDTRELGLSNCLTGFAQVPQDFKGLNR